MNRRIPIYSMCVVAMSFALSVLSGVGARAVAAPGPPLWHVVDSATDLAQRPAILDGQRSLWCGKYDPSWPKPGYPNCTYQILYVDTGSHASNYSLTLLMNVSAEYTYDFLYLVGGGGGAVDPIGSNSVLLDQAVASGLSGSARRLVSWTGSILGSTPGATAINATGGPVSIIDARSISPATLSASILIPAEHRAL